MRTAQIRAVLVMLLALASCNENTAPLAPARLFILPENPSVQQGGEIQLTATVLDVHGLPMDAEPTFTSGTPGSITVSPSGLVTSIGPVTLGRVDATYQNVGASVFVSITQRAVSISFSPDPLVINRSSAKQLQVTALDVVGNAVTNVTRRSLNPELVQIGPSGNVEAGTMLGTTGIEVTAVDLMDTVEVVVTIIPAFIDVQPHGVVLRPGGTRQMTAHVRDVAGLMVPDATAEFGGPASSVFEVSSGGLLTSLGPLGTGTVEVTYADLDTIVPVAVSEGFAGVVTGRTLLPGAPYAVAIDSDGDMVVTRPNFSRVSVGTLPETSFPVSIIAGGVPLGLDITPDGKTAYIAMENGMGRIDLTTNSALPTIGGFEYSLHDVKVSPSGDVIYAAEANVDASRLYRLSASTHAMLGAVPAGIPNWILPHPTLPRVYVTHYLHGIVVEHDATSLQELHRFTIGGGVQGLAFHPEGTLLVALENPPAIQEWDLTSGTRLREVILPQRAFGIAVVQNRIVVTLAESGWVQFLDVETREPVALLRVDGFPRRPATSPDGSTVVVPNGGGWVDFIQ